MNNASLILSLLDRELDSPVELTLYGRAALQLGFDDPLEDFAVSRDIDAVLWLGQAEELNEKTNFWQAIDKLNHDLADQELYISHFFVENQVILRPDWKSHRRPIKGTWKNLKVYRLGDEDLLLSKMMRDDPIDQNDARFIISRAGFSKSDLEAIISAARVPDIPETVEQFTLASRRLIESWEYL